MRLLVGLGNPGEQYQNTRHNAGFWLVDAVAKQLGATSWQSQHGALIAKTEAGWLVKPQTYMNLSGESIGALLRYYKIEGNELCVACDDVYLAPGTTRIRTGGGDGGHNGLKSLHQHAGSDYLKVRIGVGVYAQAGEERLHQPDLDKYVLQPMPHSDHEKVQHQIDQLAPLLVEWLATGELAQVTHHH